MSKPKSASHLRHILNVEGREIAVEFCSQVIKKIMLTTDIKTVVSCGLGGISIASITAYKLHLGQAFVRKREGAHSEFLVEGGLSNQFVIIDDMIESGRTMRHIFGHISSVTDISLCKAIILYNDDTIDLTSWEDKTCKSPVIPVYSKWRMP